MGAPRAVAEAALTRLLRAAGIALAGALLGYGLLGLGLGVAAGWSREAALDQAVGLGVHAGVVLVRGVLPAALATGAACLAWRRWRGVEPGAAITLALALAAAALVTGLVLTAPIGAGPRLVVSAPADAAATVSLLGVACAGADLLARRRGRPRGARLRLPSP